MRRVGAPLALALAVALGGCGLGPGAARSGAVRLEVTRNFGQVQLAHEQESKIRPSDTVMRFLQTRRRVTTIYGGGFVQSIDGLAGNRGALRDWFFYVNGSESEVGAADYTLSPGDVIQWDYHSWRATEHIPAIVGAYPEPFVHGYHGRRYPVRLECDDPQSAPCQTVSARLTSAGVVPAEAAIGSAGGQDTLSVVVGRWSEVRRVATLSTLARGPAASGVFARFEGSGALQLLDNAGHTAGTAPTGTGLVAATAQPGGSTNWVITGVDETGVGRAADALDAASLRDAFAVAVTPSQTIKLPVGG